jgi:gamma-glutamyltranspeptidase/glutathione hydrolase
MTFSSADALSTYPFASRRFPVFARNVVATSQPLAAQAGLDMLRCGGNAVDAALATAICLTVVEPTGNGIGGDAFAIVWDGQQLHGLNGSGRSPGQWSPERFATQTTMPESGWDTVTVPGAVDAWATLSKRFGKLPFDRLFESAIRYAEQGFIISPSVAAIWSEAHDILGKYPEFVKTFLPGGRSPAAGEKFNCPQQAETLKEIAATHGESFYRGNLARRIADQAKTEGGALEFDDLATHASEWVKPLEQEYHGICLHEIPPNGQGLAALVALGILRQLDIQQYPMDSAESIHLQVEAMKISLTETWRIIADPIWMSVDPQDLLNGEFLTKCANKISMDRSLTPSVGYQTEGGTVYLCAADQTGMMVSFIQSNYFGFGSGIVIKDTGISLQNRGRGFTLSDKHPNQVSGHKRPYHTIIPGFVTSGGQALLSFGVMGALMQPQGHVQLIIRIIDYGLNPQAACDAPRWYVDENFQLALEPLLQKNVAEKLAKRGHRIVSDPPTSLFGGAQLIACLPEGYCGASDHRKDGQAIGY